MDTDTKTLEALSFIEENDVKFIRLQFCDLQGQSKNIAISDHQISRALAEGIPFDASSVTGCGGTGRSELVLYPDLSTIEILPWRPQQGRVARILCDVRHPDGRQFEGDSRYILKRQIKKARDMGLFLNLGAECEFFLFHLDEDGNPTRTPVDEASYFDLAPFDKGENTRREIILTLENMGFEIESSHHESAPGQHEIDFKHSDPLGSADNIMTFKTVVKTIAQRNGLHATFMPKPITDQPGSGMHINLSLTRDDKNLFAGAEGQLSDMAAHFMAGVLAHIRGITAVANPLVNSYKRLIGGMEAPQTIGWDYASRQSLIRIPQVSGDKRRMELRSPDPACNPYLTYALVLAAGLSGIEKNLPLQKRNSEIPQSDSLPLTLAEAIACMEADPFIAATLGQETADAYICLKKQEWQDYISTVHDWEISHYLKTV
ncbi:MAG: glutamine synthetase family protein [Eubacterium sp.]|nr:glutamine synthetase family protein [Eubacterium sp.]